MHRLFLRGTIMATMISANVAAATLPNQPVQLLDLQRYVGQWHEIAHLPLYFQRHCVDQITATYRINPDGSIAVHNACRTGDGSMDSADGVASKTDGPAGALEVRFAPGWLSWLPWVWADYWVIELDPDYQWAVVGSPSKKYLWILSRSPEMDGQLFQNLRSRAEQRGYPVNKLVIAAPID